MKKITILLLCLALTASLLCACSGQNGTTTETTIAPTEASTAPQILTGEALNEALTTGMATLDGDITLTQEVIVYNSVLEGNGHHITGPAYVEGQVETENALTVTGGTVQNVSVSGAFRGIGDNSKYGVASDVRLKNVNVDSQTYTLNFGYGTGDSNLYVEDSSLYGWSSYTRFNEAIFTNCTFGYDSTGEYGNLRPYIKTTLIGCKFEGLTAEDGTVKPFGIRFKAESSGISLMLEDCYVGDTLITEENVNDLLGLDLQGNTLTIHNTN
jgi:hypothetical protein